MRMKVNTQSVNFVADKKLIDFIQKRMDKLDLFYDKIIQSDVYLKVENTSDKENKIVEAKVSVPGDSFIVKKQCKTFEEGADTAASSLERLLKSAGFISSVLTISRPISPLPLSRALHAPVRGTNSLFKGLIFIFHV